MKKISNSHKVEQARNQGMAPTQTSKQTLAHLNEERWLSATNKSIKSQTYELGRHKRTW
jgi:hypothetical protein